jgi:hypothetical protein
MIDGDARNCFARVSFFASALAVATKQLSGMAVQLNSLSVATEAATSQIQRLFDSAALLPSLSQAVGTGCQGRSESPTVLELGPNWLNSSAKVLFLGELAIQATKFWVEALPWIWSIVQPKLINPRAVIAEIVTPIWRAVAASEIFDTIAEAGATLMAAVSAPEWAAFGVLVAAVAGALHFVWRNFTAVVRAIRKLSLVVADEAKTFVEKVLSAIGEVIGTNSELMPRRANGRGTTPDAASSRYRFASETMVVGSLIPAVPLLASLVQPESVGFRATSTGLRATAAAMIAVPLLVTPAGVDVTCVQPRVDTTKTASVVINSSPTITIDASDCGDIEQRVLEALRKHREEIYAQWCNELQRRQRTEF